MKAVTVKLFTLPQAACGSNKISWFDVAHMLRDSMERSFPDRIEFRHIEFMSPEWFSDPKAQNLLELQKVNFPFVFVDDMIACAETKVNFSKIKRQIEEILNK